jgi:hypothetical protein
VRLLGLIAILTCCSGCNLIPRSPLSGYIYEHYRKPYTLDLDETPVNFMEGGGKVILIKEPFTGYGVSAEFNSNAMGDLAKRYGLKRIYWADMEYFHVLGIWKERRLHIYGE